MILADNATTVDKATLAAFSLVDILQTQDWLHDGVPTHKENDPLLGQHPTLLRMAATGVLLDEAILHIKSPTIRRLLISVEIGNVARNFTIGMKVKL